MLNPGTLSHNGENAETFVSEYLVNKIYKNSKWSKFTQTSTIMNFVSLLQKTSSNISWYKTIVKIGNNYSFFNIFITEIIFNKDNLWYGTQLWGQKIWKPFRETGFKENSRDTGPRDSILKLLKIPTCRVSDCCNSCCVCPALINKTCTYFCKELPFDFFLKCMQKTGIAPDVHKH